jgi:hypothetical protein
MRIPAIQRVRHAGQGFGHLVDRHAERRHARRKRDQSAHPGLVDPMQTRRIGRPAGEIRLLEQR